MLRLTPQTVASLKKSQAEARDDEPKEQIFFILDSGHAVRLSPAAELPPRVVDLLKHIITLDLVGHFDLLPPLPFLEPLLSLLDVVTAPRPSHRPAPHKLRIIPDPFGPAFRGGEYLPIETALTTKFHGPTVTQPHARLCQPYTPLCHMTTACLDSVKN